MSDTDFFNTYVSKLKAKLDETVGLLVVAETKLHLADAAARDHVEESSRHEAIVNDLRNTINEMGDREKQVLAEFENLRVVLSKTKEENAATVGNLDNALRLKTNEVNELNAQLSNAREEAVALKIELESVKNLIDTTKKKPRTT